MGKIGGVPNNSLGLARADHVLNELDRLARTDCSPSKFYADLLGQLKTLLDVVDCSLVVPVHSGRWCAISATCAAFGVESEGRMAGAACNMPASDPPWGTLAESDLHDTSASKISRVIRQQAVISDGLLCYFMA